MLVLAPDPGGRGGIQRATRALLHALVDTVGEHRVGIVASWSGPNDADVVGTWLRDPPDRVPQARTGLRNKLGVALSALRTARQHRGDLVVINVHAWMAPVAWAATRLGRARFAQWAHGSDVWFHLSWLTTRSLAGASFLFAPSAYTLARLREAALGEPIAGRVVP